MRGDADRRAEVVRERADVRAGRGADAEARRRSGNAHDFEFVDGDRLRRQRGHFALARQLVRANAADFLGGELRRHLLQRSDERRHERREVEVLDVHFIRLAGRLAGRIVRVGGPSELDDAFVRLFHPHQIGLQPRRFADAEHEQARGQRIERAGVADLLDLRAPPELFDGIVRGDAGFLVEEEEAVYGWFVRLQAARSLPCRRGYSSTARRMASSRLRRRPIIGSEEI